MKNKNKKIKIRKRERKVVGEMRGREIRVARACR
jgi:hypothetical protein